MIDERLSQFPGHQLGIAGGDEQMVEAGQEFFAGGDAGGEACADAGSEGDEFLAPEFIDQAAIAAEHDAQQGLGVEARAREESQFIEDHRRHFLGLVDEDDGTAAGGAEMIEPAGAQRRGFCPSCGARRMVETAALLVDEVLPHQPIRQWVLSLPFALRYLLATRPEVVTQVLGIVYRAISGHLIRNAGLTRASAATGAVTLIQRFGSALNVNVHLHMLVLDGIYRRVGEGGLRFVPVPAPSADELKWLAQRIARNPRPLAAQSAYGESRKATKAESLPHLGLVGGRD